MGKVKGLKGLNSSKIKEVSDAGEKAMGIGRNYTRW